MTGSQGFRVLLVEDSPDDAFIIEEALAEGASPVLDFEVAQTLAAARKSLSNGAFEVILTDLNLPDSSGLDTVEALHRAAPQIPLVVLTGVSEPSTGIEALRRGADDYLPKNDITATNLARSIQYAIERAHTELTLQHAAVALEESEAHYRLLAENASDIVWQLSADGVMKWVSPSIETVLGWSPDERVGRFGIELVHPDDRAKLAIWRTEVLAGQPVSALELRIFAASGEPRWMSVQARPTFDEDGAIDGRIVGLRDIQQQVLVQAALVRSEQLLRLAMDGAPQGMALVGMDLEFVQVNPALCSMLGRDEQWLLVHTVQDVVNPEDLEASIAGTDSLRAGAVHRDVHECRWRKADGSDVWVIHSTGLLRDDARVPLFYVYHLSDNTAAHWAALELAHRASHDPLTGLMNRDQLQERITGALSRRPLRGAVAGLLYCDLDHFKLINDTYGHAGGDHVLETIARRVESVVREGDIVNRIGGDEFVVVLVGVFDQASAVRVAEKIRQAVSEPLLIDGDHITTAMSIGVAMAAPGLEADQLMRNADRALYAAKNAGRDQVATFSDG